MTEQVSDDELKILEELFTKDATAKTIWRQYSQSTNIVISRREYEQLKVDIDRLKRLDENVKQKITELKNKKYGQPYTTVREHQGLSDLIYLLESLQK
jgi:hypothetical protein